ncbi:MAG: MarR family transcriptional regulator [Betaproteobacteria bacterium]|nr:MarR family transcriptional regulator [Betaproteobacteria bacterium]
MLINTLSAAGVATIISSMRQLYCTNYIYCKYIMTNERIITPLAEKLDTTLTSSLMTHEERTQETLRKFRIIFSSVKKHFQDIELKCGVTGAQLWAISEIADSPGLRVSELARVMSIHQSTASNLVGELEKKHLVKKKRGEDQRVVYLFLTERGNEVMERAPKPMIGILPDALQRLPTDILNNLSSNMDVLIAIMHHKDEAAATKPLSDI